MNKSMIPSIPTNKLITPFTVKNANPTFDRSFAFTSECSTINSTATAATPLKYMK